MSNKELTIKAQSDSVVKYSHENIESLLHFCETIIKSGITNFKSPEAAATAILTGQELGLPAMATIHNIHVISGKPALGINVYTALLLKHNIVYQILEDFKPLYRYARKKSDGTSYNPELVYDEDDKPTKEELGTDKLIRATKPTDYRTKIRFVRNSLLLDGKPFEIVHSFSITEAQQQELTEKDNWKKMPKTMLRTRTITTGARLVAPDLFMGVYELSELADSNKIDYHVTEEGKVEIIEE
jgi:hypothetical protein